MSRTARLMVILAAWAVPVVWVVAALGTRPSDGTAVWSLPLAGGDQWGSSVTVRETYGQTLLLPGDVLMSIDSQPMDRWLSGASSRHVSVGDTVHYHVLRVEDGSPREYDRTVTLTRFPLGRAVVADLPLVLVAMVLLVSGGVAFFFQPGLVAARAFLGFTCLVPLGLASYLWGLGAIDLAGGRGYWPLVVSEVLCALGLGLAVLAAATLRAPAGWLVRHPWVVPVAVVLPFAGYVVWAAAAMSRISGPARTQALLSIAAPSLIAAVPAVLAVLMVTYLRADSREVRLAARLVIMVLVAGFVARLLLGDLPARLAGSPVLPWDVLLLLIVPPVLAGVVVALVGYRLDAIEPAVRRTLVQGAVAAGVGTTFVVVASTIGRATDVPVGAILAGGVVALVVLPVAVALQRGVRRLVYGDRDLPRSVVAELRRLDATTPPSEALTETLSLLSRRLRLSRAAIEVPASNRDGAFVVSVGEARGGSPVVVDLVAGGASIGWLTLEADPARDPFGRADRRLLEDVGAQVGALVQAVLANRELVRSRQELVTAREEERRRLRRDLHDGLGPSLATMVMRLEAAQELIESDPGQAAEMLGGLADVAQDDITEVRRLVDGLRPPALDQLGLVSALRQRAAQDEQAVGNQGMRWRVEAGADVEPLPAAVEVAAYRIALEAVTNAVRHGHARACTVTLRRTDGHLQLRVEDDGVGLDDGRPAGVGLLSMRERAEELGGTCAVASHGRGTVVTALLPIGRMEDA